jgi:hypothetical protein
MAFGRPIRRSTSQLRPPGLDPTEGELRRRLAERPTWRVVAFDNINWIDPFTGKLVPAPFDWQESALHFLRESRHWQGAQEKSLDELRKIRWAHYLREHVERETRLRLFDHQGAWLNPISGGWSAVVKAPITMECLHRMAEELAAFGDARPDAMQALDRLLAAQAARLPAQDLKSKSGPLAVVTQRLPKPAAQSGVPAVTEVPSTTQFLRRPLATEEASRARDVQRRLLGVVPAIPGYQHALVYEPVDTVGGDFYDAITLRDGRLLLVIGDVSGHGAQAALIVASALKTLRLLARDSDNDLADIICAFNDAIFDDLLSGQFLTGFFCILDPASGELEYLSAGHHDSLIGNTAGLPILDKLGTIGMAIGLMRSGAMRARLKPGLTILRPGDTLLIFTDGAIEVHNAHGREMGLWSLAGSFVVNLARDPERIVQGLRRQIEAFGGGTLQDDLTLFVLRRGDVPAEGAGTETVAEGMTIVRSDTAAT